MNTQRPELQQGNKTGLSVLPVRLLRSPGLPSVLWLHQHLNSHPQPAPLMISTAFKYHISIRVCVALMAIAMTVILERAFGTTCPYNNYGATCWMLREGPGCGGAGDT